MSEKTHAFPRSHHLGGKAAYSAVYSRGIKSARGPLLVYRLPNSLKHSRWGLSISRRFGSAPKRNRVKRLLRESIRHLHPAQGEHHDFIIVIRPHEIKTLADYQQLLGKICAGS